MPVALVVSDTNVFIALFKCNLLIKVFAKERVNIVIPTKIYQELTKAPHRVIREYPPLSQLITAVAHNNDHNHGISLCVLDIRNELTDIQALQAHYDLEDQAILDKGEREAIPLTIQLSATFISCDEDAITEYEAIEGKNDSSAQHLMTYCEELLNQEIITKLELQAIVNAITQ